MQDRSHSRASEKRPRRGSCLDRPPTNAAKLNHPSSPHSTHAQDHGPPSCTLTGDPSAKVHEATKGFLHWPSHVASFLSARSGDGNCHQCSRSACHADEGSGDLGEEAGARQSSSTFDELLAEAGQQIDSLQRDLGEHVDPSRGRGGDPKASLRSAVTRAGVRRAQDSRKDRSEVDYACAQPRMSHGAQVGPSEAFGVGFAVQTGAPSGVGGHGRKGRGNSCGNRNRGRRGWSRSRRRAAREAALARVDDEGGSWLPEAREASAEADAEHLEASHTKVSEEEDANHSDKWIEAQLAGLSAGGDVQQESSEISDVAVLERYMSDDDAESDDDELDGEQLEFQLRLGSGNVSSDHEDIEVNHCLFSHRHPVPSEEWLNPGADCVVQRYRGVLPTRIAASAEP
jgi:hypothetical protein